MPSTTVGRGDEAELYLRHHDRLVQAVGRVVNAPAALVEDACQTAWLVLLRRQPDRGPTLFGWLRTVAVHEAYRLSRVDRRHAQLEDLVEGGEWEAFVGGGPSLEDAIEARRALAVLAPCRTFSARIWRWSWPGSGMPRSPGWARTAARPTMSTNTWSRRGSGSDGWRRRPRSGGLGLAFVAVGDRELGM